uniref:Peptidase aspartic putative domain-containing protein n=1 Tax=Amphimedon queenslandica TaxID=400682 RepID=A0A1X7VE22_AMPQE
MRITTFGSCESKEQSCLIVIVNVECLQDCEHLQALSLADDMNDADAVEFDLLVGLHCYWEFLIGETILGRNGPRAVYSKLGWALSSPVTANSTALITHVLTTASQEKSSLRGQLCKFQDLEALVVKEEESMVHDQFSDQVKYNGTRYEVSLP